MLRSTPVHVESVVKIAPGRGAAMTCAAAASATTAREARMSPILFVILVSFCSSIPQGDCPQGAAGPSGPPRDARIAGDRDHVNGRLGWGDAGRSGGLPPPETSRSKAIRI